MFCPQPGLWFMTALFMNFIYIHALLASPLKKQNLDVTRQKEHNHNISLQAIFASLVYKVITKPDICGMLPTNNKKIHGPYNYHECIW